MQHSLAAICLRLAMTCRGQALQYLMQIHTTVKEISTLQPRQLYTKSKRNGKHAQTDSNPTHLLTVANAQVLVYNYAPHQSAKCPL